MKALTKLKNNEGALAIILTVSMFLMIYIIKNQTVVDKTSSVIEKDISVQVSEVSFK